MTHNLHTRLSAISQDLEPEPSLGDGLDVQKITSAGYASAKSDQWVEGKS
jgi:predicted dehydrogenase